MAKQQHKQLGTLRTKYRESGQVMFDDRRSHCRRALRSASAATNKDKRVKKYERRNGELSHQRQDNWWLCVGYASYGISGK